MSARLNARPNDDGKIYLEEKTPEGKTLMKAEGTSSTTANTAIKRETTGKTKADEKKVSSRNN